MVKILHKKRLNRETTLYELDLPEIAARAEPGQFVILRVDADGERIPLTIADFDRNKGTITVVAQEAGATTRLLSRKEAGEELAGVSGPLGKPVDIDRINKVLCIGGGVGIACIYPVARAYNDAGSEVISIIGARTKELLIFENRMRKVSKELLITTDDGSYGEKGFVTDCLKRLLRRIKIDLVFTVGPAIMMQGIAEITRPLNIETWAGLNPLMVDGTGMCGACRISVDGKMKFACVDGPHFNAHLVDFEELIARQKMYQKEEKQRIEIMSKND